MSALLRQEFARTFSQRLEDELDTGHGACVLRQPALARNVTDALHHFMNGRLPGNELEGSLAI